MNPIDAGYITVADRLAAFVEKYPNGRIQTHLESITPTMAVVSAEVWRERSEKFLPPDGTGLSSMPIPGPTNFTKGSEVENAETSAIGRALAAIGFLAKDDKGKARISSSDEVAAKRSDAGDDPDKPSAAQMRRLFAKAKEAGVTPSSIVQQETGKLSSKQLTRADLDQVFTALEIIIATGGGSMDSPPARSGDALSDEEGAV
jgi:hypothetical protein